MPWIFFANLPLNIKFFGEYAFGSLFFMFKVQIGTIFSNSIMSKPIFGASPTNFSNVLSATMYSEIVLPVETLML